jgi:hypothetical protein
MKRTKLLAYIFNLYSMSAVAGYECTVQLTNIEDPMISSSEKMISIDRNELKSRNMGTFAIESQESKRLTSIQMNAVMSGWQGEEDIHFVMMRRFQKRSKIKFETISEIMSVKGDKSSTFWFDNYRLDIDCNVKD